MFTYKAFSTCLRMTFGWQRDLQGVIYSLSLSSHICHGGDSCTPGQSSKHEQMPHKYNESQFPTKIIFILFLVTALDFAGST